MSQRTISAFGTVLEEYSVWPCTNWVSDLTSPPLASVLLLSDKAMCGQCYSVYVCIVDKITVFICQNEMTKRRRVTQSEMFMRVGVLAGSQWTKWK